MSIATKSLLLAVLFAASTTALGATLPEPKEAGRDHLVMSRSKNRTVKTVGVVIVVLGVLTLMSSPSGSSDSLGIGSSMDSMFKLVGAGMIVLGHQPSSRPATIPEAWTRNPRGYELTFTVARW